MFVFTSINSKLGNIGKTYTNSRNNLPLNHQSMGGAAHVTLPAGTYIVVAHVQFDANATGIRRVAIGVVDGSNTVYGFTTIPASASKADVTHIAIITLTEQKNIAPYGYQDSGATLNASFSISAISI